MRKEPTLRIPLGILALLAGLVLYCLGVAWLSKWIELLPVWAQTIIYVLLGVGWLLPLKRFLVWMETGSFRIPDKG